MEKEVQEKARALAEEKIIDIILPTPVGKKSQKDETEIENIGNVNYKNMKMQKKI